MLRRTGLHAWASSRAVFGTNNRKRIALMAKDQGLGSLIGTGNFDLQSFMSPRRVGFRA